MVSFCFLFPRSRTGLWQFITPTGKPPPPLRYFTLVGIIMRPASCPKDRKRMKLRGKSAEKGTKLQQLWNFRGLVLNSFWYIATFTLSWGCCWWCSSSASLTGEEILYTKTFGLFHKFAGGVKAKPKQFTPSLISTEALQKSVLKILKNIEFRYFLICWLGRVNLDSSHLYNASKPNRYETKVIKKVKISLYKGRARVIWWKSKICMNLSHFK